ncbi:MAG TPA: pentapeptide repeat-containing protein [Acidimicrobiales bacterium]|nr:pentapeptide repeat-containing protein [Acidimicrobiales bacterium]
MLLSEPNPAVATPLASVCGWTDFSGPTFSGPTFSGPTFSGPTFSGPTFSGSTFSGPTQKPLIEGTAFRGLKV